MFEQQYPTVQTNQHSHQHHVSPPHSDGPRFHHTGTTHHHSPQPQTTPQHTASQPHHSWASAALSGRAQNNTRIHPGRPGEYNGAFDGHTYRHPIESQEHDLDALGRNLQDTDPRVNLYQTSWGQLEQGEPCLTQWNENMLDSTRSVEGSTTTENGAIRLYLSQQNTPGSADGLIHTVPAAPLSSHNVVGILDETFEPILHPRGFFKKGRIFMTLWVEPQGFTSADLTPEGHIYVRAFAEMSRFVVIRSKPTHCLCLRLSTYNGQGTNKSGVIAGDHAVVVPVGEQPLHLPLGEELTKGYLPVKLEAGGVTISPMSRINFAKVYTIGYNIRVRNIGRVDNSSMATFEEFFLSSLNISK